MRINIYSGLLLAVVALQSQTLQAQTWTDRGEYDLVLTQLERLFAQKAPFREYAYVIPEFDPLHDNPRFQALLRQIGLPLDASGKK